MKFKALVADSKSGREFETSVPAGDEREARRLLKQRGLLVSQIEPVAIEAETIEYQTPSTAAAQAMQRLPANAREGPHFICPNSNCRFEGRSIREPFRSNALGFFLLLIALVPGILYLVLCPEYRDRCPKCGVHVKL